MSTMRTLAGLTVLAIGGVLLSPTAALAATSLKATIVCDAATGTVTTSTAGTLLAQGSAPTPVIVEFQRQAGTHVTATTSRRLAPLPQPFTVRTTATASGDVAATGYTGTF